MPTPEQDLTDLTITIRNPDEFDAKAIVQGQIDYPNKSVSCKSNSTSAYSDGDIQPEIITFEPKDFTPATREILEKQITVAASVTITFKPESQPDE